MRIPVTLAGEKLLDEGYESCWLLQPPTVDALLNGYFFHIFIIKQSFLKFICS